MSGRLLFLLGIIAVVILRENKANRRRSRLKQQMHDWENEGGNVPNVPTPTLG